MPKWSPCTQHRCIAQLARSPSAHPQDLGAPLLVGPQDADLAVKAPRTHEGGVQQVRAVGGRHKHHACKDAAGGRAAVRSWRWAGASGMPPSTSLAGQLFQRNVHNMCISTSPTHPSRA